MRRLAAFALAVALTACGDVPPLAHATRFTFAKAGDTWQVSKVEVLPAELSRSDISDLQRGDHQRAYDRIVRWMFDRGADRDGLTILGHS